MQALYISKNEVEVQDLELPVIPPGESLVQVILAGICDTDLQLQAGYMGFEGIPGHEFVGKVIAGDNPRLMGKRVVGEINVGCKNCPWCRKQLSRHCPYRTVLGILNRPGAHAEYLLLPHENLHIVPSNLSNLEAVFTEPLAAACEILEQIHLDPSYKVAVVGDGKLGLLISQVLALSGCEVLLVGHHAHKVAILKGKNIETMLIPVGGEEDLPQAFADVVVEATGSPSGFLAARRLIKPRGILVLKSTYKGTPEIYLASLVIDEITLLGSRCGPFEPALRLLSQKNVEVNSLVENSYPLYQGPRAYEEGHRKGALKVLLEISGD